MKTKLKLQFLFLIIAGTADLALGQGTAFTYQGRLSDGANPATGIYDLRFTIYDLDVGGSVVSGPITNATVGVSNGLFTVTLDFGSGVFTGPARWLEIGVRTNGGGAFATLTPRQKLTASPYAITAGNLSGTLPASQVSGTISVAQLPAEVVTNGASDVILSGTFSGNGAGVTNVNLLQADSQGAITFATNPPGGFLLAATLAVGSAPWSVTAADLNGDGRPDLISANPLANTLAVFMNNGSGGFVLVSSPGVGAFPQSVTSVDVNGDGKLDLISANSSGNALTVLTNNGSGGFVVASSPGVGSFPWSVTASDVNGDGTADLISANAGANTLTVLTNNGSGGFVLASSPGVGSGPQSVTAADVNGDGWPDLISANNNIFPYTLTVLTNNGSGSFAVASSPSVGFNPRSVTAADVNGDGQADLISANSGDATLTVLTNMGSGGFVLASSPSVGSLPYSVTAADVNGDGWSDLISANWEVATLTVLTNNGSGGFAVASSPGVGFEPRSVTAADVNGDGRPDLISANSAIGDNTLTVLLNQPPFTVSGAFAGYGGGLYGINASQAASLSFGATLSQKLNLWNTSFGIGIQSGVQYYRVGPGGGFAWYRDGVHNDNSFNAGGGTTLMTLSDTALYVNGAFVSSSDRNRKEQFEPVEPLAVLAKVAALPISQWNFKADTVRHIGPMAQDFYAAFGVGPDDKHIATVDADGVALAAIQGLNQKVEQKATEITELKQRLEKLERLMNEKNGGAQ